MVHGRRVARVPSLRELSHRQPDGAPRLLRRGGALDRARRPPAGGSTAPTDLGVPFAGERPRRARGRAVDGVIGEVHRATPPAGHGHDGLDGAERLLAALGGAGARVGGEAIERGLEPLGRRRPDASASAAWRSQ